MMGELLGKLRDRLDDLDTSNQAYDDSLLERHLQGSLDKLGYSLPLPTKQHEELVVLEALIRILKTLKMWADGESYSYKSDAVQVTRGLMARHYGDTIKLLTAERNEIMEGLGGFYSGD